MKSARELENEMTRYIWIGLSVLVLLGALWNFGLI